MAKHGDHCHLIPGLLAIPPGDEAMRQVLDLVDGSPSQRLPEILEGLGDEDLVAVTDLVGLVEVADPHEAAARVAEIGVPASPIHAVGFPGHTKAMAGTSPEEEKAVFPEVPRGGERNIVAVVDTGISEELPGWMADSVIREPGDLERLDTGLRVPASHGTFVCSVIRQITPSHVVSIAAARPDTGQLEPSPKDARRPDDDRKPTNELEVAAALERLIRRHSGDPGAVRALNLSLGGYKCESGSPDSFLLTMSRALDHWRRVFTGCTPIFASGGNSTDTRAVFPAAYDYVRGVGAGRDGAQVVWESDSETRLPTPRDWIGDVARGSDVIGLSGQDERHAVRWSGSSFASAVAVSSYLKRGASTVEHGIVWWPESVGGLHHG